MTPKTFLSQTQANRLAAIRDVVVALGTQTMAASRAGMSRQGLIGFLWRELGSSHWPPNLAELESRLALAVLPDAEARRRWSRASQLTAEARERRISGLAIHDRGRPPLAHDEIERRKQERDDARAAHEARWLEAERALHGETRQTRVGPISGMAT